MPLPSSFSHSAADTYEQCPKKWETIYQIGVEGESTIEATLGVFAHGVLERVMTLPAEQRTLKEAKKEAQREWKSFRDSDKFRAYSEAGMSEEAWLEFRRNAWAAVARLWALEDPTKVEVVSVEQKVRTEVAGVPFVGIIDRVDRDWLGELTINDYKTGKIPHLMFTEKAKRQIRLYAAAWEAQSGELPGAGRLVYLKGKGKILEVEIDRGHVDEATGWISDQWSRLQRSIETDEFEERPGPLCGWCPALPTCLPGQDAVRFRIEEGKNVGPGALVIEAVDAGGQPEGNPLSA
jgi:putative RecB family exonuclease